MRSLSVILANGWGKGSAALAALLLGACGTTPPLRMMEPGAALAPAITTSPDGRIYRTILSVLTYNIEGLGWPARSGRAGKLAEIGRVLAGMRERGTAPDVVMFQEMFSGPAKKAVLGTGYPAIITGPHRTTRSRTARKDKLPGKARFSIGEIGLHLTGSGIAIASRYPIVDISRRAYGKRSCAGIDCLSNKGVMLARIEVPGLPVAVDLYNTHMNSRGASKAPAARHRVAHARQALEASEFVAENGDERAPLVFGGDFNMRHSEERWANFSRYHPLKLVHETCAKARTDCDVRMSWDGDAPWMDTQDLQFYASGTEVAIRPIKVEAMFDGGAKGARLSDHDGFLVTYELSWPVLR